MYMYNEDQCSFKHETDRVHTKCIASSGKIGFTPLLFYLMVDIIYISDTDMDRQGYICTFCGLALSVSNHRQHKNSKHKQAGPYVCCGKRYHSKANWCRRKSSRWRHSYCFDHPKFTWVSLILCPAVQYLTRLSPISNNFWTDFHASLNN